MANSSNEADGKPADQPRFSFPEAPTPTEDVSLRSPRRIGAMSVLVFVLLITVLAVSRIPDIHDTPPPPLQTLVSERIDSSPRSVVAPRKKIDEPLVRVNVTPGGVESLQLELRGPCDLKSLETETALSVHLEPGTITVTSTRTGLTLGSQQISTNQIELQPERSPAIRVNGHLYRGRIRLFRRVDGKVSAVNVLPIEEYLASVVDSEMPAKFPEEARQSQAIVARTYALYQIEHANPNSVFDLLSSQRSQKYLGMEYVESSGRRLAGESESSRRAVQATRGVVCTRHKKLFCTYYSAVCGGQTTDGDQVFKDAIDVVRSVPCDWCRDSPHFRWTTEMPRKDFQKLVYSPGNNTIAFRSIRQESNPGDGSISRFEFDDGQKRVSITGIELRERLPAGMLFSPHFDIKLEKTRVVFEGRGHGHGVGFCQWGAKGQAEAGRTHLEIVRHYFPGAELTVLHY